MPPGAAVAAAVAVVLGVVLTLLEARKVTRFLPAPVAMGTAFLIPASYAIAMFLGAMLFAAARRRWATKADELGPAAAAGGIAGEAVIGVAIALLTVIGVLGPGS